MLPGWRHAAVEWGVNTGLLVVLRGGENKLRKYIHGYAGHGRVELGCKLCAPCESCYSTGRVKEEGGRG